ncbi:MAG: NYN domain-containing protein [Clostridiales Family XIII bacterium]|jgi:hypothetical protein|nr:NYN domain-containing protein [Clostridiales Family XIII bacterium]
MENTINNRRVAVLIDAENVSYKLIDEILDEVALHGRATNKRIYGDFTKPQMKGWNSVVNEHSLHQVTQISYTNGKNSSDSVLIINAMDILYAGNVESVCIVSSDSDFTRLAMRIVESGLEVIGMGEEKTAESFINACTTFKFLGTKQTEGKARRAASAAAGAEEPESAAKEKKKASSPRDEAVREEADRKYIHAPKKVVTAIRNAIKNSDEDNDGWIKISVVGDMLHNRFPDFDPTIWGAKSKRLSEFLTQLEDFEVEGRAGNKPNSPANYHIRIKK